MSEAELDQPRFLVARNPEADMGARFLLLIPTSPGELVLKSAAAWPGPAGVACSPAEWPEHPEILESVPIRSCTRRAEGIELVLDRDEDNRSQLRLAGTPRTGQRFMWNALPSIGGAVPRRATAQAGAGLIITVDGQQTDPYSFDRQPATAIRGTLRIGDYGAHLGGALVAAVRRVPASAVEAALHDGGLAQAVAALTSLPLAAVVIEADYAQLAESGSDGAEPLAALLAQLQVEHVSVPLVVCADRAMAEDWTFRFLNAARRQLSGEPTTQLRGTVAWRKPAMAEVTGPSRPFGQPPAPARPALRDTEAVTPGRLLAFPVDRIRR